VGKGRATFVFDLRLCGNLGRQLKKHESGSKNKQINLSFHRNLKQNTQNVKPFLFASKMSIQHSVFDTLAVPVRPGVGGKRLPAF
jgi:hypothetical protein